MSYRQEIVGEYLLLARPIHSYCRYAVANYYYTTRELWCNVVNYIFIIIIIFVY